MSNPMEEGPDMTVDPVAEAELIVATEMAEIQLNPTRSDEMLILTGRVNMLAKVVRDFTLTVAEAAYAFKLLLDEEIDPDG